MSHPNVTLGTSKMVFHRDGISSAVVDSLHISAAASGYVMRLVARGCADTRDPSPGSEPVPRKRTEGYEDGQRV